MIQIIQGSQEWHQARLGKLTASRFADAIAKTKSGWGASRYNLMADLIVERKTGVPTESYMNVAMQRGIELEPEARAAYAFYANVEVVEVGFVPHPSINMAGASPDGLVGEDGLVEFKCPNSATHLATLRGRTVPDKYLVQCQWQIACTGRQWCDWVSYDPRWEEHMRLYIKRINRSDDAINILEKQAREFLAELDAEIDVIDKLYGTKVAA